MPRPTPFDPIERLRPPSRSELNRLGQEVQRIGSLQGPGVVSSGLGVATVPPERTGLVLATIKSRSAAAPFQYEWTYLRVLSDRTTEEREDGTYGGWKDPAGNYQTPAVDPADPDGKAPRDAGDPVWLQWDDGSRYWLIVAGADGVASLRVTGSHLTATAYGQVAVPATWDRATGAWAPAAAEGSGSGPGTVRVIDPNGNHFAVDEYVPVARLLGQNPAGETCYAARGPVVEIGEPNAGSGGSGSGAGGLLDFHIVVYDPVTLLPTAGEDVWFLDANA